MSWVELVVILAAWLLLQAFVLPRLGVPTWAVPKPRRPAGSPPDDAAPGKECW